MTKPLTFRKEPAAVEFRFCVGDATVHVILRDCRKREDGGTLPLRDFLEYVGLTLEVTACGHSVAYNSVQTPPDR